MNRTEIKNSSRYKFTNHSKYKMAQYRLSPSLLKRIIRFPERVEEGVAEETVAAMKKGMGKKKEEIWTMYQLGKKKGAPLTVITAWRYPGVSPKRDPIPREILEEIRDILK